MTRSPSFRRARESGTNWSSKKSIGMTYLLSSAARLSTATIVCRLRPKSCWILIVSQTHVLFWGSSWARLGSRLMALLSPLCSISNPSRPNQMQIRDNCFRINGFVEFSFSKFSYFRITIALITKIFSKWLHININLMSDSDVLNVWLSKSWTLFQSKI